MTSKKLLVFPVLLCCLLLLTPGYVNAERNSHYIEGVPLADQDDRPWCGPVCLVMVLRYWDIEVSVNEVGLAIDPEEDGSKPTELVDYLDSYEFGIFEINDISALKEWISRGHPLIVLQWTDETKTGGHYRVVVGFDETWIYIHDPNGFKDQMSYEQFILLWSRFNQYGVTISPIKQFVSDPDFNRTFNIEVN